MNYVGRALRGPSAVSSSLVKGHLIKTLTAGNAVSDLPSVTRSFFHRCDLVSDLIYQHVSIEDPDSGFSSTTCNFRIFQNSLEALSLYKETYKDMNGKGMGQVDRKPVATTCRRRGKT